MTWKGWTKLFTPPRDGKVERKKTPKVGYIDIKFCFCFRSAAGAWLALESAVNIRVRVQTTDTRTLATLFDLFFDC